VRVDRTAFSAWLADQRTFELLARLAARPEAGSSASLHQLAGECASELLATAAEYRVVEPGQPADPEQTAELIACTVLALWTESDASLRPLFILLADTAALRAGQEDLRQLVRRLLNAMAAGGSTVKDWSAAARAAETSRQYRAELGNFLGRTPRWHPGSLGTLFLDRKVNPVMMGQPTGRSRFGTLSWRSAIRDVRIGGIVAPAGFGKTWALRALLAESAASEAGPLPVWTHAQTLAAAWDEGASVLDLLGRVAGLTTRRLAAPDIAAVVSQAAAAEGLILVVDALDEVHDSLLSNRASEAVAGLAEVFRSGDCRGQLLFSSRLAGFENPVDGFGRARDGSEVIVELVPFDFPEVERFFDQWSELQGSGQTRERLHQLTRPGSPLRNAVTVPLLASLCAWVAEDEDVAPTKSGVYGQVVDRFLERRWKQGEAQSPLGQRTDDPAWRHAVRRSLGQLAAAMAMGDAGWQEQASPIWCDQVLTETGCPAGPTGRSRTWSMCFEVGALTPIGLAEDTVDVPVGWIHRSVQQFLVADHLAGDQAAPGLLAGRCNSPEWTDVAVFLAGHGNGRQSGNALLSALCAQAAGGNDPFGMLSELIASVALERPDLVLPHSGSVHLQRQLANGLARPSLLVPALREHAADPLRRLVDAGVLEPDLYESMLTLGQPGQQMLEEVAAVQLRADGAAAALAEVNPAAAVRALLRRADTGLPVSGRDARVLRHADDALRARMLDAYESQPHNLARADLAAAAGTPGTLTAFLGHLPDEDRRCRLAALNGLAVLLSFEVPREIAVTVRQVAETDADPQVRILAQNIIDTWEIGSPAALQSRTAATPADPGAKIDAGEFILRALQTEDSTQVSLALQLLVTHPVLQALPAVSDLVTSLDEKVRAGEFDWRWVDSLVRLRPALQKVLVDHVAHGDERPVRNAALALPYLDGVPVAARLAALASALGRLDERWSAASFEVLADRHPQQAVEVICHALGAGQYRGPSGVRRLVTAGRRALELLSGPDRSTLMPLIAGASADVSLRQPS
jgi:hypothetical protein